MKSLMPWVCLAAASSYASAWASEFDAYRLGHYNDAVESLQNAQAQKDWVDYYKGRMRLYGYGTLRNEPLAVMHLKSAAGAGLQEATLFMASYALNHDNDLVAAFQYYKKAAEKGNLDAQMYCAASLLYGFGTKASPDAARKYIIDAAKAGNPIAAYTLAMDFIGSRHPSNKKLGLIWLSKAVKAKLPAAELQYGEMLYRGQLMPKDEAKGLSYIQSALKQKESRAELLLAQLALEKKDLVQAKAHLEKAIQMGNQEASLELAKLYFNPEVAFHDNKAGFLLILDSAQEGNVAAQKQLAEMYQKGQFVEKDEALAKEWQKVAQRTPQQPEYIRTKVLQWLTANQATRFTDTVYAMKGILSPWSNPNALQENNYNPSPKRHEIGRGELFNAKFELVNPKAIAVSTYLDLLVSLQDDTKDKEWRFPSYPLAEPLQKLVQSRGFVVQKPDTYSMLDDLEPALVSSNDSILNGMAPDDGGANAQYVAQTIIAKAALGDADAGFMAGQIYQYGIGVPRDLSLAMKYYDLAATLQDERAQYALAVMLLEGDKETLAPDHQNGFKLLAMAAFKGDPYAQYAMGRIYENGYGAGPKALPKDDDQAQAMFHLAAKSGYGPAQYYLAKRLARQKDHDQSVASEHYRTALIKRLLQEASRNGIKDADLPLAYYFAMEQEPAKQQKAFRVAREAAEAGNQEAAILLGIMYDRGIATTPNENEALYWFEKAGNNPVSEFILGSYAALGVGERADKERAISLLDASMKMGFSYATLNRAIMSYQSGQPFIEGLQQAYQEGNTEAGLLLADYYITHASDESGLKTARKIYQHVAETGDKKGQLKYAYLLDHAIGGDKDLASAHQWYLASAEQGLVEAQFLLGQFYELGRATTLPLYDEAIKWYSASQSNYAPSAVALGFLYETVFDDYKKAQGAYEKAVVSSDPVGLYNLGLMYDEGKGMAHDVKRAEAYYFEAANRGHAGAMTELACLYLKGDGQVAHTKEAAFWFKKAAALHDPNAEYYLGLLYETGIGENIDFEAAKDNYQKAAEQGNEKAMFALARMHQYGLGIEKNEQAAMGLYQTLASRDNPYAQYQLALFLLSNEGKPKEAEAWLQKASNLGFAPATAKLQNLKATQQVGVSFIAALPGFRKKLDINTSEPDRMYLYCLNTWNRGDEEGSRKILNLIVQTHPDYLPARKAYEQLMRG